MRKASKRFSFLITPTTYPERLFGNPLSFPARQLRSLQRSHQIDYWVSCQSPESPERAALEALLEVVVGAAYEVSNVLGAGFLEKLYERALIEELRLRDIPVAAQATFPVAYKGKHIGTYAADLVVDGRLLVEIKCADQLSNEHLAQCINYLKASGLHLALPIDFRKSRVEWRRVVHNL
jgi:GxxExxY protein